MFEVFWDFCESFRPVTEPFLTSNTEYWQSLIEDGKKGEEQRKGSVSSNVAASQATPSGKIFIRRGSSVKHFLKGEKGAAKQQSVGTM